MKIRNMVVPSKRNRLTDEDLISETRSQDLVLTKIKRTAKHGQIK